MYGIYFHILKIIYYFRPFCIGWDSESWATSLAESNDVYMYLSRMYGKVVLVGNFKGLWKVDREYI